MSTPKSPSFPLTITTKNTNAESTTTTNEPVANSANTNKNVTSKASPKDLIHYVNIINLFLNTSVHTDGDTRLQLAIQHLYEGLEFYPDAYELKFLAHKISIKEGDMSQAIESFDELRRLFPDHESLKEYLVQITHSVRYQSMDDKFIRVIQLNSYSGS
ncbi:hypothetical protein GLOIN_2v1564992 [Rhizophagus clarus]|uniref:Uncharacterized protein n=1 Tax=Rhizophagus clarus TaxID=94130 RepID=A0A8H3QE79_9GLOM|nr:hypothetical protein GLOIN_2v1564992 [Rhizophagus clarus]